MVQKTSSNQGLGRTNVNAQKTFGFIKTYLKTPTHEMGESELAELAGLVLPLVWQRPPAFHP